MDLKKQILERTRQGLDVFNHYVSVKFITNRPFKNPLYHDTKPSCFVYFNKKNGVYMMKDFGEQNYSGDCFWYVAEITGMDMKNDFQQILHKIIEDMCLPISITPGGHPIGYRTDKPKQGIQPSQSSVQHQEAQSKDKEDSSHKMKVAYKEFTAEELAYWAQYGITKNLLCRYKVRSGKYVSGTNKENRPYKIPSTPSEPMFVYHTIDEAIKVYRPRSNNRFLYVHPASGDYVFGLEHLPNQGHMVFITGGEKDVMSLAAHGFSAICFNSETALPPAHILDNLQRRFKHIVLLYDMDKTGKECSVRLEQDLGKYKVKRLELPLSGEKSEKDISDFFALGHTKEELDRLINELIKKIYKKNNILLKSSELDYSNPPPKSSSVVEVNDVPIGACDNLLCITGGEGVGKSHLVAGIISGTLCDRQLEASRTLGLTITLNKDKKAVLLFDTEQSEHQLFKNVGKSLRRAYLDGKPEFFHAYHMTELSRKERLETIRTSLDVNFHQHNGIQLVVIDGVADLIRSANDEIESIDVVDELYRLAGFYHCCIICVLHFLPNGTKLRGHIGSELQRKAAGILSIEKENDQDYSVIKAIKVRDGSPLDIPMMLMGWDKDENMFVSKGVKSKEEKEKRKLDILRTAAFEMFKDTSMRTYKEMVEDLCTRMSVKDRTAKDYVKYLTDHNIIDKVGEGIYQLTLFKQRT